MDESTLTARSSPTISDNNRLFLTPSSPPSLSPTTVDLGANPLADEPQPRKSVAAAAATARSGEADSGEGEFFDLQPPPSAAREVKTEDVMKRLFSAEHLHLILGDPGFFCKFSSFLNRFKPNLVPTLIRYLEMRKAIKAIEYANSVASKICWPSHTDYYKVSRLKAAATDVRFKDYAEGEMLLLCSEALPAFVTHVLVGVVTDCLSRDMAGQGIPILRDLVGDLAEVFCLTDPSVHDNPIIFASQEFHRTTQYGTTYAIDRNCRFLQGPGTDKNATLRIAKAVSLGQESNEVLLNYRRDGTPFVNLLMCSPLYDDKGTIRYYIGAQVDVTGLVVDGLGIESFRALLHKDEVKKMEAAHEAEHKNLQSKFSTQHSSDKNKTKDSLTRLQELSMMFSQDESDVVNRNSRGADDSTDASSIRSGAPSSLRNRGQSKRVIIDNGAGPDGNVLNFSHHINKPHPMNTTLPGIYRHASQPLLCLPPLQPANGSEKYLLVRPYPSLQIIFVSPSLRIPGLLRTHLFTKLGGPTQTIAALESAFRDGASVTAKVLWLPKNTYAGERGRGPAEVKPRYIRCTPLLGSDDRVGVWMVVLVPVDGESIHDGYPRDAAQEMLDEMGEERKFYDGRSASTGRSRNPSRAESVRQGLNFDTEIHGGLGSKSKRVSRTGMPVSRGEVQKGNGFLKGLRCVDMDEKQLYAEYLRSSSATAESREDGMPMRRTEG
ncbi:hypothetical protein QTJ16_002421 [Diplocarpon rosae]|uniref:PAC domain-containing protein n=1 Tax=Diplocarpon rosae TaxID=946125 RepID=A0AAD9T1S4_9HELO|nr:hypothetical protein QTJ16_002421 [Diplocarpon rosae]